MPIKPARARSKSSTKAEQILHAATRLFLDQGFDGTSMDGIAATAGVSKQTVYSHFGSKEELFSEMIDCRCVAHELTDDLFDLERPIAEVMHELAEHLLELLMTDEAIQMFRLCVADNPQQKKVAALYWQAGPAQLKKRLSNYIAEHQKRGHIKAIDPHFPAQQFIAMIRGEAYMKKLLSLDDSHARHNPKEIAAYLDCCVDAFTCTYLTQTGR